jgi:hypothetical protein
MKTDPDIPTNTPAPLALRPRDAARALGIGQRMLWEHTHPRGPIPCIRVGTCCLYPVDELRAWLARQARAGPPPDKSAATLGSIGRDKDQQADSTARAGGKP